MRVGAVAASIAALSLVHRLLPTGPDPWHVAHLLTEKAYYVPILAAAAWFPTGGVALACGAASIGYLLHVQIDWTGHPMLQAEQTAHVATFWLVGLSSSLLVGRWRSAVRRTDEAHRETLRVLAASLELRERYTAGHSERVLAYTLRLADVLGIRGDPERRILAAGALFHDVGKIGIPDAILLKEGPLTAAEREVMRRHPAHGADLVGHVRSLAEIRELVLRHHERFDGSGYPGGMKGSAIPFGARLFALADAYDAMTTTRPYRPALPDAEARRRIREGRGTHFDPAVVDAFLSIPPEEWLLVTNPVRTVLYAHDPDAGLFAERRRRSETSPLR